jgi:hypothetical protein
MLEKLGRPSPATVIACLALFFAVAGGSAFALAGRNSVDSGDIKKGQVKTSDLANNAVTTKKIKGNAVRTSDIQNGQVKRADLAPAENVHLIGTLGTSFNNGGEGDCIWSATSPNPIPYRFTPPGFYKDALGYVHLVGIVFAADGPGGDGMCGGPGAGEQSEDYRAFTLPAGYRPTSDVLAIGGGMGTIIIGSTPLTVPPDDSYPAGAVTGISSPALLLEGTTFEPAGVPGGVPRRGSTDSTSGAGVPDSLADLLG